MMTEAFENSQSVLVVVFSVVSAVGGGALAKILPTAGSRENAMINELQEERKTLRDEADRFREEAYKFRDEAAKFRSEASLIREQHQVEMARRDREAAEREHRWNTYTMQLIDHINERKGPPAPVPSWLDDGDT